NVSEQQAALLRRGDTRTLSEVVEHFEDSLEGESRAVYGFEGIGRPLGLVVRENSLWKFGVNNL
ncbi:MAG: hypothetical protein KDC55_13165, partial [Ignavibacteriae bacterium]|nr:hypothetical protein [Ignavibacteriota bacterium]